MTHVAAPWPPPVRVLLGPGPSPIASSVLQALAASTVGHLDPYYLQLMNEMQRMLRAVFRTENPMTMAISGTGSAGMETTVVNLIEPGDAMIVLRQRRVRRANGRRRLAGRCAGDARSSGPGAKCFRPTISRPRWPRPTQGGRHRDGRNVDRRFAADRGNCPRGA